MKCLHMENKNNKLSLACSIFFLACCVLIGINNYCKAIQPEQIHQTDKIDKYGNLEYIIVKKITYKRNDDTVCKVVQLSAPEEKMVKIFMCLLVFVFFYDISNGRIISIINNIRKIKVSKKDI